MNDAVIGQGAPAAAETAAPQRMSGIPYLAERAWTVGLTILRRDSTVRRALALADVVALAATLLLAAAVGGDELRPWALLAFPVLILFAKVSGLYDRDASLLRRSTLDEVPSLFQLATLSALLLWLAGGAVVSGGFDAGQAVAIWFGLFASCALLRAAAREVARRVSPIERCLFVGDRRSAEEFRAKVDASRGVKAEVVSFVEVEGGPPPGSNGAWASNLESRIGALAAAEGAQRVVLAPGPGASEELVNAVRQIKDLGLKVSVLPRHARVAGSALAVDRLDGITLLGIRRFHITRSSRVVKRGVDLLGAIAGLLVCAPLLAAIAVAIRLDTPGPVLYRQQRAGRDGHPFGMLKFRSMSVGADERQDELASLNEAEGIFKLRDDPRVTRVGRFLRRHSLDELPQLWNVLRGEMSLVGPRPLPLAEDRLVQGWHRHRLDLRPGITGPWQLLGPTRVPLREMVNLDNQYVADWSLWTDLRILLLTIPHVLARRGV